MKTTKLMIASLLILVAMGAITVSCEKAKTTTRKAALLVDNSCEKTGGDEDPIIRVRVKKKNTFVPIYNAFVETMSYVTGTGVNSGYTDSLGEYDKKVTAGIYYFKVTPAGGTTSITDTVHVNNNVQVTILVD